MELEKQKTTVQDEIDMANYQHEQYMNARKAEDEAQHKLDMLRKESTYLNNQLAKDGTNERYAKQIEDTAKIRTKGLRKTIIVNMKQDLLKQKLENDTLEKVGELMNEEPTEEEKQLAKSKGENTARSEILKERQRLKNEAHTALLKLATEQANTNFHDTKEYKDLLENNKKIKIKTQKNLNDAEEMKKANEAVRMHDESRIAFEVQRDAYNIGPSDVQQVTYLYKTGAETFQKMKEKSRIVQDLNAKITSFQEMWNWYASLNPKVVDLVENDETTPAETLREILFNFSSFIRNPPRIQPTFSPQSETPLATPNDVVDIGHFNDEEES